MALPGCVNLQVAKSDGIIKLPKEISPPPFSLGTDSLPAILFTQGCERAVGTLYPGGTSVGAKSILTTGTIFLRTLQNPAQSLV